MGYIKQTDFEIAKIIELEADRQEYELNLIASENTVSPSVMEAQGSILTNKYAEGYPSRRYYGGCEFVDQAEDLAIERAKKLFNVEYANVQPHSGSQANMAVYFALLNPGDRILAMDLSHGGHLTHGAAVSFSGRLYDFAHYGLSPKTQMIDLNKVEDLAKKHQPKLIVAGASAYPRIIDFKGFSDIAKSVGALFMVDMAHIAGLVAAGVHPSPVGFADVITSTTHKTLRGPRGGLILSSEKFAKAIGSQIFPGIQGGPLMHVIAAKAVAFKEALEDSFADYQKQVIKNTAALASVILKRGYKLVSGGTDNHMVLVDFSQRDISGKDAEERLGRAGITVNKNTVPNEKRGPFVTSGIRIGLPLVTSRGMDEAAGKKIATFICDVLDDEKNIEAVARNVRALCIEYPLYVGKSTHD
ncbi:serine hydroxymethyltransferase [Desulfobacula toluolica]|uniref:Serine hydroxymethyltransferase n=1 Tax=Desulfobacula toluolica (strain DSM 7467 / Tol2) TaxID=651182 RepID=K0NLA9_DESTT|nr:serine hydroxymethyltransferase [Desulfobacula toluolica]CCK81530.1 GlyA: serine hydroxymethyltransferase [Desulfobacula toluolica Tol2]